MNVRAALELLWLLRLVLLDNINNLLLDISRPFAERLFSRHESADLATNLKHKVEEVGDRPCSNMLNGQDDGRGVGELFREDERHMAEKDFKPVFWKALFRCVFLCVVLIYFHFFLADLSCQCCDDISKSSVSYQGWYQTSNFIRFPVVAVTLQLVATPQFCSIYAKVAWHNSSLIVSHGPFTPLYSSVKRM